MRPRGQGSDHNNSYIHTDKIADHCIEQMKNVWCGVDGYDHLMDGFLLLLF